MDPVARKDEMEKERFKLSGDIRKIKSPPKQDHFYVSFLELLECQQEDMATIFKAVIHG